MTHPLRALLALIVLLLCGTGAGAADIVANGIFLIAKPEMRDPRFHQAVVLITQPPDGGPFGVIINRPLELTLSEVFPEQPALKGRKDVLYYGGPVARDSLMFLVRTSQPPARAMHVLKDVYITGDFKFIETLLKRPDPMQGVRVFSGYSGWGESQLQDEIDSGAWYVLPAIPDMIFSRDPARAWPELLSRATQRQTQSAPAVAGGD